MPASTAHRVRPAAGESAVMTLLVDKFDDDALRVAIPRPEIHLVARFGASARDGLDIHVLGVRDKVHRKIIRGAPAARRVRGCDRRTCVRTGWAGAQPLRHRHALLVPRAAELLARTRVTDAAAALCMSERNFRRVFQEVVGVSPKAYSRLVRFRRAVRAAREDTGEPGVKPAVRNDLPGRQRVDGSTRDID